MQELPFCDFRVTSKKTWVEILALWALQAGFAFLWRVQRTSGTRVGDSELNPKLFS